MPNNNLVMDEAEMNAGASSLGMCSTNVSSASSGVPGKFSGATNSNMMNKSVGEVTKQLNLIGTSISGVQGIISKHSSEMFGYDRIMAKLADDIEIPTDFLANNSMEINTFNRSLLEKTDGTSVNEGQADHGFRDIDDSTISAEGLHDMGDDQTKEQKYDESSVIGKSILGNISNEGSQEQEYDDDSAVQKGVISDISGNTTQEQ